MIVIPSQIGQYTCMKITFKTGVKYPANPNAVPFTELITFCMVFVEFLRNSIHRIVKCTRLLSRRDVLY